MPTIDERCWDGYEPVPGKEPYSDDSCRPEKGKGKGKAEGDGVPDKVKEIADAIKRDNPGISDEKKMRIAWSTYKKMGKGKDAAGMGSGYGSPSDIGVTGMIPYPAEQTCSSLIERLQEERTDSQQNVLTEGFVSKLARAIKVRYKDFPEERKVLLDGIMKGLRGKLPKGYKPVLDRNYGGITIHYGKMGLPVGVAFGSKKKEIFAEVTTPHGDLAYPEFSNSWIEDPQPAIGWAVKVLTNGTQNYAALAVDYPHMLGEKAEEIITEAETYSPPQGARNNAKKVLKWKEEHGNEVKAMTQTGWTRANQLASGENLSLETVKRMAAFERHRQNATVSPEHKGEPWKDNGHVAWLGWGGDAGVRWAKGIVNSLKENGQLSEDLSPSRNDLGFYNDIIDFFGRNPYPFDWQVHQFAAEMGVDREKMEWWIYRLLTDLLGNGGYIDFARGTQEG